MSIKIPIANISKPISRNIVKQMASDGYIPVIALEAFVEAGRTYQAYQRGGFDEARERITEEFSGAVFWLGGVTGLNWLFEKIGQKINKLPSHDVSIAEDSVRKPLSNYLADEKVLKSTMAKFKFTKVISSVLIANAFIGFVLPKINQAITRSYHKDKGVNGVTGAGVNNITEGIAVQSQRPTFDNFIKKEDKDEKKKDVSFGINLLSIANKFESDRNYKLLAVDAGTASGRAYSARNNDERVEILFRDLSSIYFYMFNMQNMNKWLNKIEQKGVGTRLDPQSAEFATKYMENYLDTIKGKKVNAEQFTQDLLGKNEELPENIAARFKGKGTKITSLKAFNEELEKLDLTPAQIKKYKNIAEKMSQLQPQLKGISVITEAQARDVLNGGHINNPEFLREFFKNRFGTTFMEKYKYVAQNDLDSVKKDLINYVKSIAKKAQKTDTQEVTLQLLRKASNNNLKMNALNWGAGFATSALFLSTLIPKMQYMITKWRTGSDSFPGTVQFQNQENKAA